MTCAGDLHTHTDLTDGVASLETMVDRGAAARLRVLRGHRPRAEPVHAADDRREDAGPAGAGARADAQRTAGLRLLHGTELNIDPDGEVDWDRGLPGRLRHLRRLGALALRRSPGPTMTRRFVARLREPARQHHRPPHHPADRPAPAGRRRLRRGVRGPAPAPAPRWRSTPPRTGWTCRPTTIRAARDARGEVRHRQRRALRRPTWPTCGTGSGTAQRGWLTPDDVINTWPLDRLRAFLRKDR